jgi:hypothetical protein
MNEFKKPFEYEDEKGISGILLILFFMLISVEPLLGIASAFIWKNAFAGSDTLLTLFIGLSVLFILFSFIAGIALKKAARHAVLLVKAYLVYRFLYLLLTAYVSMKTQADVIPYAKDFPDYAVMYNSLLTSFLISILYVVVFSVGWYIYLVRSKRVRECFPAKAGGSAGHSA